MSYSQNRLSGLIFEGYTTLIRGVPDLVLMLLIFYSFADCAKHGDGGDGRGQIDINPMVAGIMTLVLSTVLIFTKTFVVLLWQCRKDISRRRRRSVLLRGQVFRRIMFPAMMRYALPGIGNGKVILKSTALVSLLGLEWVVKATQLAKVPGNHYISPSSVA
ncbi:ABC transporter permease subunit [Escherichia coli]